MRIKHCIALLLLSATTALANQQGSSPKLYLNIVVDQLRTDFLYEFSNLYGEDGFKRLMSGGRIYENAYYAFENIDRATAVATLATVQRALLNRGSLASVAQGNNHHR